MRKQYGARKEESLDTVMRFRASFLYNLGDTESHARVDIYFWECQDERGILGQTSVSHRCQRLDTYEPHQGKALKR